MASQTRRSLFASLLAAPVLAAASVLKTPKPMVVQQRLSVEDFIPWSDAERSMYLIGEAGPELFMPWAGGVVTDAEGNIVSGHAAALAKGVKLDWPG